MKQITPTERRAKADSDGQAGLRALNIALREAFLNGTAYDPDGSGKAYWQARDESGKLIEVKKTA